VPEVAFFLLGDLPCSIWRHEQLGHLCGYIGVPKGHPWYGKDYDAIEADVHGGLTHFGSERLLFRPSRERQEYLTKHPLGKSEDWNDEEYAKLPRWNTVEREEAFPHDTGLDVWWLGFDCAHAGDHMPTMPDLGGIERDEAYVRAELEGLAGQAAEAARGG